MINEKTTYEKPQNNEYISIYRDNKFVSTKTNNKLTGTNIKLKMINDTKLNIMLIMTSLASSSGILDYTDHLTFTARVLSIVVSLIFLFVNWKKITKRIKEVFRK